MFVLCAVFSLIDIIFSWFALYVFLQHRFDFRIWWFTSIPGQGYIWLILAVELGQWMKIGTHTSSTSASLLDLFYPIFHIFNIVFITVHCREERCIVNISTFTKYKTRELERPECCMKQWLYVSLTGSLRGTLDSRYPQNTFSFRM